MSKLNPRNDSEGWKVYQVVNEQGEKSFIIIHDIEGYPENYLEYDEEIETSTDFETIFGTNNVTVVKNW